MEKIRRKSKSRNYSQRRVSQKVKRSKIRRKSKTRNSSKRRVSQKVKRKSLRKIRKQKRMKRRTQKGGENKTYYERFMALFGSDRSNSSDPNYDLKVRAVNQGIPVRQILAAYGAGNSVDIRSELLKLIDDSHNAYLAYEKSFPPSSSSGDKPKVEMALATPPNVTDGGGARRSNACHQACDDEDQLVADGAFLAKLAKEKAKLAEDAEDDEDAFG